MADINLSAVANTEVAIHQVRQWYDEAMGVIRLEVKKDMDDLLDEIKEKYVPIDTGALRDTGKVLPVEIDAAGNITTGIEFGSDTVVYARIQHENLEYNHPHGQAKYIEVPLRQYVARRGGQA